MAMTDARNSDALARALQALADGRRLGEMLTTEAFAQVMAGAALPSQIGALLMGLRVQGETEDEVVGVVRALRDAMIRVPVEGLRRPIDTCGTGGGSVTTFNISTAAALVAVAGGAVVAKHGNRSYTSKCGSADLLEALGVAITVGPDEAAVFLRQVGMAFLFAPAFHPTTAHITPVRRALGVPTIMNLVGPLANPAGVARQVIGVWDGSRAPLVAGVLARLGTEHALVVHADVGMDEISPVGITRVWEVREARVEQWAISAADYGLARADLDGLAGGAPESNAARIERLLEDPASDSPARAAVTLNAGAALYVAGVVDSLREGVDLARERLDTGMGAHALAGLRRGPGVSTSE